jgi:formylglycine-generating enzyme required for sulfatase activity
MWKLGLRLAASGGRRGGETKTVPVGSQSIVLHWCPAGSFTMGAPASEDDRSDDETLHRVRLTEGFWMGETEVTQGLWKEVTGENPSVFKSGDDYPVENVSWDDCQGFLRKLNDWAPSGFLFVLPREDQWEYACRAGSTTVFFWGDTLNGNRANCNGNYPYGTEAKGPYRRTTMPVRSYEANQWGLFDMHGNVMEWCANGYYAYPIRDSTDLEWPTEDSNRVLRGGSWNYSAGVCRSACRVWCKPNLKFNRFGLRMALVPEKSAIK